MKFNRILILGLVGILFLTTIFFSGFTTVENNESLVHSIGPGLIENILIATPLLIIGIVSVFLIITRHHKNS